MEWHALVCQTGPFASDHLIDVHMSIVIDGHLLFVRSWRSALELLASICHKRHDRDVTLAEFDVLDTKFAVLLCFKL